MSRRAVSMSLMLDVYDGTRCGVCWGCRPTSRVYFSGTAVPIAAQYRCSVDILMSPPASSFDTTDADVFIRAATMVWVSRFLSRMETSFRASLRRHAASPTKLGNLGLPAVRSASISSRKSLAMLPSYIEIAIASTTYVAGYRCRITSILGPVTPVPQPLVGQLDLPNGRPLGPLLVDRERQQDLAVLALAREQ